MSISLEQNLNRIKDSIGDAALKAGRNPENIKLLGVTKYADPRQIKELFDLGLSTLGENRVQELQRKASLLSPDIEWHMIGHLQRNKVKKVIPLVNSIQSVDSERLAEEINRRAKKYERRVDILIQVNIARDENKFGLFPDQVDKFIKNISGLNNINIQGLMTILPYFENPEDSRPFFKKMYDLFRTLKDKNYENVNLEELSMGMSNDYQVAVEEGSTWVRIGSALFDTESAFRSN